MPDTTPLLVTSALPYANGNIHLGHLVENIQSDIYVRFQRLLGRDVRYLCAADTHGTPIEVNAKKQGIDPAVMVERYRTQHAKDFAEFQISFDLYYTTNSDENRQYAERVYKALKDGGHVFEKPVEQFYCETDKRFLPDRFVKGTCPFCGTADQYGDVCESCNKTYTPTDLKSPYCVLCKSAPVRRESNHLFVRLSDFTDFLREYSGRLQPEVKNYVHRWLDEGLKDWGISRDGPYFGFPIPGSADKYFYVWLDAPIGYISTLVHYCKEHGLDPARWWPGVGDKPADGQKSEIWHFIGKDIIYFHTLFWPAMLEAAHMAVPSRIHVHGMLNLGGAKMSKSRGRMVSAREWLDALDPAYLRYYLAANLGPALDDIEFSTDELRNRANSQLVNNVGNLVNRALAFCATRLDGKLSRPSPLPEEDASKLMKFTLQAKQAYAELNYREAVKSIEALASWANEYMQNSAQPWKTIKTEPERAQADVTLIANIAKALATMLQPIVPKLAADIYAQLAVQPKGWDDGVAFNLQEHKIGVPKPLLPPLEADVLEKLFAPKEQPVVTTPTTTTAPTAAAEPAAFEPISPEIVFDDFAKIDLRVGKVVSAERIPKAKKVLKLSVDLGEGEPRTILSGIALAYEPEELVGKQVIVVANLAPREMFGFQSRGMLLAASGGPKGLTLADVPGAVQPGARVK